VRGDTLLLVLNGGEQNVSFALPTLDGGKIWVIMIDTARRELPVVRGSAVDVEAHSLMLLRFGDDRRIVTGDDPRRDPLSSMDRHAP
jgi:hypothetical protein